MEVQVKYNMYGGRFVSKLTTSVKFKLNVFKKSQNNTLNDNNYRTIRKFIGSNDSTKNGENNIKELTEMIERLIQRQRLNINNDPDVKIEFL